MASKDHTQGGGEAFDDLEEPTVPESSGDDWLDLEPGDSYVGKITGFRPNAGRNGIVEIDGRSHRLNATMRDKLIQALVVGQKMGVRMDSEESSFENDDGETVTYHEREVRF